MTMIEQLLGNLPEFMPSTIDTNNYKFLNSFVSSLALLEDNYTSLGLKLQIDTATDDDLDNIGKLFKLARVTGETDDSYRARILSFWQSSRGGGTDNAIINTISNAFAIDTSKITITLLPPCKFRVSIDSSAVVVSLADVLTLINKTKAAGTYCILTINTTFTESLTATDSYIIGENDSFTATEFSACEDSSLVI